MEAIPHSAFWTLDTIRKAVTDGTPPELLREMLIVVGKRAMETSGAHEVSALLAAGWMPNFEGEPFQWKWRRPPKGKRKVGRMFASTGQAYLAMMRE